MRARQVFVGELLLSATVQTVAAIGTVAGGHGLLSSAVPAVHITRGAVGEGDDNT